MIDLKNEILNPFLSRLHFHKWGQARRAVDKVVSRSHFGREQVLGHDQVQAHVEGRQRLIDWGEY